MRPILVRLAIVVVLLTLAVLFSVIPTSSSDDPGVPPRLRGLDKPARGPELIRRFFDEWHDPYPGDLSRELQDRIWADVAAVPAEWLTLDTLPWQNVGPDGMIASPTGRHTGRVLDLDVGPDGLRRLAAASGGVWESVNFAWQPLTEQLTTQWIGSLATSPVDPELILAGTGEPWIRAGTGLWRSTDGGATWQNPPLPASPATCFRVRFQPDGQTVVGAFDLGIYRSLDAGQTWTRTALPHWPTDLALHPDDPSRLWTTVYEHGVHASTDGGVSWSQVQAPGLPTSGNGRGAIVVAPSDPERLYVAFAGLDHNLMGVYRSDDGGLSWSDVSPPVEYFWGQGWYNNAVGVSPVDPDLVLAGGGGLQRSDDGGATWTTTATPHVHADVHAIAWSDDGADLWVATDGGYSHSADGGLTYNTIFNRMPITQFVMIDASDYLPLTLGGGSQDNGISLSVNGGGNWHMRRGGDGGGFTIDETDTTRMWSTNGLYSGDLLFRCGRSLNEGLTWADVNTGLPPSGQWNTRIRSDHADPPTVYTNNGSAVYQASANVEAWTVVNSTPFPAIVRELTVKAAAGEATVVYACLDSSTPGQRLRVRDGGSWFERSSGLPAGVLVRKVAPHPVDDARCFALMNGLGTPGQKVYRSEDRGASWVNITGNLPDLPLSDLVAHPSLDGTYYLGTEFGCYMTEDDGQTWQRWNTGMPDANVVTEMVLVDLREETGELLVAAGSYGRGFWLRPIPLAPTAAPGGTQAGLLLRPARPNPASHGTEISFRVGQPTSARLRVLDVRGRVVATLVDGPLDAGDHAVRWDSRGVASGLYLTRLETAQGSVTRRVMVIR